MKMKIAVAAAAAAGAGGGAVLMMDGWMRRRLAVCDMRPSARQEHTAVQSPCASKVGLVEAGKSCNPPSPRVGRLTAVTKSVSE